MTLVEFLTARLDEDEATARSAVLPRDNRVLREVEAKRAIVYGLLSLRDTPMRGRLLRVMAAIYADHPDYREEWKP